MLHAHFRDVEPILAAALLPWFFLTPIFLPVDDSPGVERRTQWSATLLRVGQPGRAVHRARCATSLYGGRGAVGARALLYVAGARRAGARRSGVSLFRRMERDLAVVV